MSVIKPLAILLALALIGCDDRSSPSAQAPPSVPANATSAPAGMSKYPYLAADGGPHMVLPSGAAGVDYARACAASANGQMVMMPTGSVSAMIFADPPMTAWGTSSDGMVEIYYLKSWASMNLDALISKATAALPTSSLADSGSVLRLPEPNAFLLFAGDTPTSTAYGVYKITMPAGSYKILVGTFTAPGESVTIYRLKPVGQSRLALKH
jgi:hypothetical protein